MKVTFKLADGRTRVLKKPIAAAIAILFAAAALAACGMTGSPADADTAAGANSAKRISVVATIFAPYDFAREITDGNADIMMLLPPGSESHSFEPTPRDIMTIQGCDVFIYVGGDSDAWVAGVLSSMDTSHMRIVTLMDCVDAAEEIIVEGMQDDGGEGAMWKDGRETVEYDEHVWTSPKNAKLIVDKISAALCESDPKNTQTYEKNKVAYLAKLDELDASFQEVVDNGGRKVIVFGDRFPFRYFADAYGLEYFAAFPGCSTETEASAATVAFLIDKVKAEKIPVVFHIEFGNEKMAGAIAEQTGARVLLLHSCHNVTRNDLIGGKTYIDLMAANAEALKAALQ
jgi:zinc transport system substrate-binding protein